MKKILIGILMMSSICSFAKIVSVETKGDLENTTKVGTSLELISELASYGPADCYNATPGSLSKELSVELCKGATSTAPADCYNATPGSLSKELSVKLCKGATSTAPAECYKKTPGSLSKELSVELCMANICYDY